jgi:mRNA-degrading endonuclease toxin of MazEF toxin-antitoxin module
MRCGEIWPVGLDPAEGHEQKGRRPVLIIFPDAFNGVTKAPVVLPITVGGNASCSLSGFAEIAANLAIPALASLRKLCVLRGDAFP